MAKRSNFKRRARDFYPTPPEAVLPLVGHIPKGTLFDEPCVGSGDLADALEGIGLICDGASDLYHGEENEAGRIHYEKKDAFALTKCEGEMFITNPPWPSTGSQGEPVISMAKHLSDIAPTWFLLSADFAHNKYFQELAGRCAKIVSVGRVSWMGNGQAGVDNAAWYLFEKTNINQTEFYGRRDNITEVSQA